jgi:glutamyl-tRNA synthetase
LAAIVRRFRVEHVPIGGPVFDVAKLDWLNARYIRERLEPEMFVERVKEWAASPERLTRIATLAAPRIERLSDLGSLLAFLFSGRIAVRATDFVGKKMDEEQARRALALALTELDALPAWNAFGVENAVKRVAESLDKKVRDVARPLYVAITGSPTSIPLYDSMELLGRDLCRERLRNALDVLEREAVPA